MTTPHEDLDDLTVYDTAYDAMHQAARTANTTAELTPPALYDALGNLSGIVGYLTEILPSLTQATQRGATHLDLYDADGADPQQRLTDTLNHLTHANTIARQLLTALQTAHTASAGLGYREAR